MARSTILHVLLLMGLLAGPAAADAAGHPAPLARPGTPGPWSDALVARRHRVLEAETKGRRLVAAAAARLDGLDKATPNMDLYDVRFYDLVLDLDPVTKILAGTTLIRAEVTGASLAQMQLDLDLDMYVPAARCGGVPVAVARQGALLTVTLDRTYLTGETVEVAVDYYGNPAGASFGWATYGGSPLVWTLSEPYGAREWWPCKDVPTDKADSVAVHATVPDNLVVAGNGTLAGVTVPAPGRKTYHWVERHPIATYLVSVTAHPYVVLEDIYVSAAGDTMPLQHFVMPDKAAVAAAGYAVTPAMIGVFAGLYGEYPYLDEKYGHAHFAWGGGMEHQTCSSMYYDAYDPYFIAHELAHQWMGDLVTCADFSHIWINEGFATWSEAYWFEQSAGPAAYRIEMNAARYLGPGTIFVEDPSDFGAIFNYNLVYQKASWVPHMLRHVLGETDFRAGLAALRAGHGFASATTADVQAAFEGASGRDLGPFFQQWIYGEYHPAYEVAWDVVPAGDRQRVMLRITQTQTNTGLFTMPLDVRVHTSLGDTTFVVQNAAATEWYGLVVDGTVTGLEVDPDSWVLGTVVYAGVSDVPVAAVAGRPVLRGNAPNPFNPVTEIRFALPAAGEITLEVYDVSGRRVDRLLDGRQDAGEHRVTWRGTDAAGRAVASGTYFVRLRGAGGTDVLPVTLVR